MLNTSPFGKFFSLSIIFSAAFTISNAQAAKIKIPEERVIVHYDAPINTSSKENSVTAGSGPGAKFTNADLARLGVVSKAYPDTIKALERILQDIRSKSPNKKISDPKPELSTKI